MIRDITDDVWLRWLLQRDLRQAVAIDQASFAEPWSQRQYRDQLRLPTAIGMAAEVDGKIAGVAVYHLRSLEIEIARLAVSPAHRRQGVGRTILDRIQGKAAGRRVVTVVRETEVAGQLLLRDAGFRMRRILRAHYGSEDGYRFVWERQKE